MATPAKVKNSWKYKTTGLQKDKVPTLEAILKKKHDKAVKGAVKGNSAKGSLTMSDKLGILEMHQKGEDVYLIAQKYGRTRDAIHKFLWRYNSTTPLARARLEGGAEELANRIIDQANVDQSLEVMDRLDILAKKRDNHAPATSFSLIIGNPVIGGTHVTGSLPVPTQKQIEAAVDAEVVKNGA